MSGNDFRLWFEDLKRLVPVLTMPLQSGTALGSYSVTAKIGEGGMGEVYRARDTKLDRDVALKVLPEAFTQDPDRLARFEREAKVLASTAVYLRSRSSWSISVT